MQTSETINAATIANDRQAAAQLRQETRDKLRQARQAVRELKAEVAEMRAEDREAVFAAAVASGAEVKGDYAVKVSAKRFTIIPKDATLPVSRGESRFLTAILSSLS